MPKNKNQHFVPRCYLKPFSINGEGLALNLFNIDRQAIIPNAALKNQCSKDYFYGEDAGLEKVLQFVEGTYGAVVREIIKVGYKLMDNHKTFLKLFWLLQYLRTEAASRRSVEMFEGIRTGVGEGLPEDFTPSIKEAVIYSMHVFSSEMHVVNDLKVCLIKNTSSTNFVTSDDPAILVNRWHQVDCRPRGMGFGLNSSGVLAFLPLSEKVLFVAYDGDVYSISNSDGWTTCKNTLDTMAFNQFQYFNCRANIFFKALETGIEVERSFADALRYRPTERHRINYAVLDRADGDYKRYVVVDAEEARNHTDAMIHTQPVFAVPPRWPSQIRWRSKGAVYTNGTGIGYVRKNKITELHDQGAFWKEPAIKKRKA